MARWLKGIAHLSAFEAIEQIKNAKDEEEKKMDCIFNNNGNVNRESDFWNVFFKNAMEGRGSLSEIVEENSGIVKESVCCS